MSAKGLPYVSERGGQTLLLLYVQPKAARSEFCGMFQERLKIRVNAPPVEGEANRECVAFLAKALDVSKSEVRLVRGAQSRQKDFLVERPPAYVLERLGMAGVS
ncbi:MAG: DUF167 domain-containing protein [Desulfobacteraceae bacterium]|nr:DUF167 domain-containing protein [Desulfobacteraceae bacterium]